MTYLIMAFIGGTNVTITSASNGVTINSTGGGGGSQIYLT